MRFERDMPHLTPERIQAYLDGALPDEEIADVRQHVTFCSSCQAELEAWDLLYGELGSLTELEPAESLRARVLVGLDPARPRLVGRAVSDAHLEALLASLGHQEPSAAFAARVLSAWEAERATEQASEVEIDRLLAGVVYFRPSAGFAKRVLAQVRVGSLVRKGAPASAAAWVRTAAARVSRLVPRTRRAWAVLSGVAVTPVSVMALLAYAVFSNPLTTPSNLASFVWWKFSAGATAIGQGVLDQLTSSVAISRGYAAFDALLASPLAAAAGAVSFGLLTCGASWVLYKNLYATRTVESSVEPSYARATV